MWTMLWPILVVVGANTLYNICAKSTPSGINAFASLSVSYFVAMLCSLGLYFATGAQKSLVQELSKVNWASLAMGVAIVGLEFGFINVYRAGGSSAWQISLQALPWRACSWRSGSYGIVKRSPCAGRLGWACAPLG